MRINPDKCIGCLLCLEYCTAGALESVDDSVSTVRVAEELCFDCGLCQRLTICPEGAFEESEDIEKYPRNIRALFSNPYTTHKLTMVPGRGTEESKTNDVTGRIKRGEVGMCIEFGRPGLGSTFRDVSSMTMRLKTLGVQFEMNNPLTQLMDPDTGSFADTLLPERILSSIIEVKLSSLDDLKRVIPAMMEISQKTDTVFSLGIVSRFEDSGELPVLELLTQLGIPYAPNAKINLGFGRPLAES